MEGDIIIYRNFSESKNNYDSEIKMVCSSLQTCSFSDGLNMTNASTEKIIQKPDNERSFFQYRYLVVLLGFSAFFQINLYRIATTISLVAMVNNSAPSYATNSSVDITLSFKNSSFEDYTDSELNGKFNWSPDIQGYILSVSFLGFTITLIPAGMLSAVYGGKNIIVSGLFVSTIFHLLSPLAAKHSSYLMIAFQFIRGAGQGFLMIAVSVICSNWIPSIERGLFNSLILCGVAVGAMISGFISGDLCSSSILGGWPSVYYLYGALGLIQCVCVQVFLYESPKVHPGITDKEKIHILRHQEADLRKKRPPTPWKNISSSIPVYAVTFAMFGSYWAACHLLSVHPIFLTTMLHFSLKESGFFVSLTFIIQIIISFSTSFASNWLNRQNLVGVNKLRKGINFIGCLGYSLCLLGVYLVGGDQTTSNLISIIGMSFNGFCYGGCMIVPIDMSPTFAGTLMGLCSTVATFSAFILPIIYGVLIEEEKSMEQWNKIFFISIAVVMSSGIVFCLFGSADVQSWNYCSEDRIKNDFSNGTLHGNKTEDTNNSIEIVTHI